MAKDRVPLAPAAATATAPASSRPAKPTEQTERAVAGLRPWSDHLSSGDRRTAADLVAEGTLVHAFLRRWAEAPNAPLWLEPGRDARRWWTNAAFEDATRRAAARLIAAGLEQGDRVVWSTDPSVDSLVAHVACLRAGLVVVPVNPAYSQTEIASVVAVTRPRGAILDSDERARWVRDAVTEDIVVTGADVDLPEGPAGAVDRVAPDDPALIGMTSGTTAAPKGALLCHRHLLAATESLRWAWRWAPEDRLVHSLPLFHSHGLCVGAYGTMLSGGSAVLLGGFDPARVGEAARQESATMFFGVPTMYHRLVTSGVAADLRGLRLCVSGSAPMSAALHAEASVALGSPVLERYGMTETLMITSNPYDGERRAGTVGYPLPGVEVRVDKAGSSPGDQEIGEVLVRGPNVFDGYVGNPAATTDAFVEAKDGGRPWFRTGDLGVVDGGSLVIRGRSKELIISGGYNVHPAEVEAALALCPGVAEVAVSGTPSDEWGEVVTAWVVADGRPPTLEELTRSVAASLAPYKRPRVVHVVDALPRNAMGKLVRSQLGANLPSDHGAAPAARPHTAGRP